MVWALVCVVALLALSGCASRPVGPLKSPEVGATSPAGRDGPPPSGAPSQADLARLPDAVPQVEPIRQGGPNKPYVVLGQSYTPESGDVAWRERGIASWYGHKFHGRRTASGELYSMYGLTAAHKTLPIPSYVRVRNVRNSKEVIVRVNDRGPFHPGRVIDLSYAAAIKLDITSAGVGDIELSRLTFDEIRAGVWQRGTVLDPDPDSAGRVAVASASPTASATPGTPSTTAADPDPLGAFSDSLTRRTEAPSPMPPSEARATEAPPARAHTPASRGFWVQLAALGQRGGVDRLQQRLADQVGALLPLVAVFHEPPYFKLQVGPYESRAEAQAAASQARRALQLQPLVIERR